MRVLKRPPDFVIGEPDDPYMLRWYIIPRNKMLNIYLHQFRRSDDDRALHDHPWINVSIVLRGAYLEHKASGEVRLRKPWRPWAPWRLTFRRATALHRIELIAGSPVWSLFLTGPTVREWGFACPQGWKHWRAFVTERPGGNSRGAGCDD